MEMTPNERVDPTARAEGVNVDKAQENGRELALRVLDTPRLKLDDLAEAAGVTRSSLNAYCEGRARMPECVRRRLAVFLEAHARELDGLAEALVQE